MNVTYMVLLATSNIFALFSLYVAATALRKAPRGQRSRIEELEVIAVDLEHRLSSLLKSHKRLNSRIAMQIARDNRKATDDEDTDQKPGESPQQWKERMRKLIARGKLGHTDDGEVLRE